MSKESKLFISVLIALCLSDSLLLDSNWKNFSSFSIYDWLYYTYWLSLKYKKDRDFMYIQKIYSLLSLDRIPNIIFLINLFMIKF